MAGKWLSFDAAVELIKDRLNTSLDRAQELITAAHASGEVHWRPNAKVFKRRIAEVQRVHAERKNLLRRADAPKPGSALDLLGESAAQGGLRESVSMELPIGKTELCEADLVAWLDREPPEKPIALKTAPDAIIESVISAVYDDADKGAERPNINKLPDAVMPRLRALGYETSGRRIKDIGRHKFAGRRLDVGRPKPPA
jgi:hypothetical protein